MTRRIEASINYKQAGNLRAVQILLSHTKIDGAGGISASTSTMIFALSQRAKI